MGFDSNKNVNKIIRASNVSTRSISIVMYLLLSLFNFRHKDVLQVWERWNSIELVYIKNLSLYLHILLCFIYWKRYIFYQSFWLPNILRYNIRISILLCQTWEYSYFFRHSKLSWNTTRYKYSKSTKSTYVMSHYENWRNSTSREIRNESYKCTKWFPVYMYFLICLWFPINHNLKNACCLTILVSIIPSPNKLR